MAKGIQRLPCKILIGSPLANDVIIVNVRQILIRCVPGLGQPARRRNLAKQRIRKRLSHALRTRGRPKNCLRLLMKLTNGKRIITHQNNDDIWIDLQHFVKQPLLIRNESDGCTVNLLLRINHGIVSQCQKHRTRLGRSLSCFLHAVFHHLHRKAKRRQNAICLPRSHYKSILT